VSKTTNSLFGELTKQVAKTTPKVEKEEKKDKPVSWFS
jgi:hypothetical protein